MGGCEMAKKNRWFQVETDLRSHPKLVASAKALQIPRVCMAGHLIHLWSACIDHAEDGDLWKGDEESSIRFFESMADIPADPERYIEVFRKDHWLDGWLVHDWLDYQSRLLISRHSSHNRAFLVQTWLKHGREYGRDGPGIIMPPGQGKLWGSDGEVVEDDEGMVGENSDPPITLNPNSNPYRNTVTLNPLTQEERNESNPMGGVGGNAPKPRASFLVFNSGSRVQGCAYSQAELTGDALSHKDVFEAFFKILVMHGIFSLESFYARVKRSRATPAAWMILYLDKIHAVYRDRHGSTMLDAGEADPVGMTMAGLMPGRMRRRHHPTEAARLLFVEIMMDHFKHKEGGTPKWAGRISGPSIALELDRRKGKAGKIA